MPLSSSFFSPSIILNCYYYNILAFIGTSLATLLGLTSCAMPAKGRPSFFRSIWSTTSIGSCSTIWMPPRSFAQTQRIGIVLQCQACRNRLPLPNVGTNSLGRWIL